VLHGGHSLNRHNIYKRSFKPLLERASLPALSVSMISCTTFATLMACSGGHAKVVQEMLGHATKNITLDLYSHVLPDMQENAVDRLGAMLS
jgi:integrase